MFQAMTGTEGKVAEGTLWMSLNVPKHRWASTLQEGHWEAYMTSITFADPIPTTSTVKSTHNFHLRTYFFFLSGENGADPHPQALGVDVWPQRSHSKYPFTTGTVIGPWICMWLKADQWDPSLGFCCGGVADQEGCQPWPNNVHLCHHIPCEAWKSDLSKKQIRSYCPSI